MEIANDNLELNCKGTFPGWGYEQTIGGVQWQIEEICHGCKYISSCIANRSREILMGESLPQESFELIAQLSELERENR